MDGPPGWRGGRQGRWIQGALGIDRFFQYLVERRMSRIYW